MMTAYVVDRAQRTYGSIGEDALQATMADINTQIKGGVEGQKALDQDVQGFLGNRYDGIDTNTVLRDIGRERRTVESGITPLRRDAGATANETEAKIADNTFVDPRQNLATPTNQAEIKGDARRAANNLIWEDNGAFDFSSNPLKALARDAGRPFIPQPEEPDARLAVGSPGRDIDVSQWPKTPEALNRPETKPEGISTLSFNPKQNFVHREGEGTKQPDPEAYKKLEEMLKKLEGK